MGCLLPKEAAHERNQRDMVIRSLRYLLTSLMLLAAHQDFAQVKDSSSGLKISGYADAYYARYSDSVGRGNYEKFPVISPKNDEVGLNIIQITAQYTSENARAIVTMHYGDIPSAAWSPVYNMVQEANAGFRLAKKFWVDAGFFKTHIGTEALLPKDNIASSLSIITLYEPWYQAGLKISYLPNDKSVFCLHILNGYNTFVTNNSQKSVGLSFVYTPNDKFNFGYYNIYGKTAPDSVTLPQSRFLNNFVFNYQATPKLKALLGIDYIGQKNATLVNNRSYAYVYSAIATLRYQLPANFGLYGRYEWFADDGIFLANTDATYKLSGITLGAEYKPTEKSYLRFEARELALPENEKIFRTNGENTNVRYEAMLNLGVWF